MRWQDRRIFFVKIDIKQAFYNIPLHILSNYVTKFVWGGIRFQYLVLSFGVSLLPFICKMFLNAMCKFCRQYVHWAHGHMDDMILADPDPSKLRFVIALLRAEVATIKRQFSSKSVFFPRDSIEYLGARQSSEGVQRLGVASRMVSAIIEFTKDIHLKETRPWISPTEKKLSQLLLLLCAGYAGGH